MPDSAPLRDSVATRMKEAMKGGDKVRVGALRLIMAALKEREIEARGPARSSAAPMSWRCSPRW